MGSGNLHVPVCNSSTAFSESFCGQPEDSAAEMTDVLFFLSSDAAALGLWPSSQGPQACRRTHQAHQCWGTQGALGALFLAFIKMSWSCHLCPFSGNSDVGNILRCHLLGSFLPQVISTPSSIPERHRMDFLSPPLAPSSRFLQFHSWLWFFQRIIIFFLGGVTFPSWK